MVNRNPDLNLRASESAGVNVTNSEHPAKLMRRWNEPLPSMLVTATPSEASIIIEQSSVTVPEGVTEQYASIEDDKFHRRNNNIASLCESYSSWLITNGCSKDEVEMWVTNLIQRKGTKLHPESISQMLEDRR
jgi:hypothetical protein